jgi:phosphoglycerate dehydrogenase-like enzyme
MVCPLVSLESIMSTQSYQVLFLTERSPRHQQAVVDAAPPMLAVTVLNSRERALILEHLPAIDFLITERAGLIDAAMLDAAPRLRLIQRLGSLTFDIDVAAARQRGIAVCAWPVVGCILVAEHMVMQMLALVKRLPEVKAIAEEAAAWGRPSRRTDENTFAYNWSKRTDIDGIYHKTVGILGFGEIGAELARRLQGFCPQEILYHKRQRLPATVEATLGITYAQPDEVVAQSDFLCNLLPFFPETEMSLTLSLFQRMKPGAFIVSCGSGSVIQEKDLALALQQGHLGGAALDTFEWEPLTPENPLVQLARTPGVNLLLTPHTAAGALRKGESGGRGEDYANIIRFLKQQPLLYPVNSGGIAPI